MAFEVVLILTMMLMILLKVLLAAILLLAMVEARLRPLCSSFDIKHG